jgi:hypothetical protein
VAVRLDGDRQLLQLLTGYCWSLARHIYNMKISRPGVGWGGQMHSSKRLSSLVVLLQLRRSLAEGSIGWLAQRQVTYLEEREKL